MQYWQSWTEPPRTPPLILRFFFVLILTFFSYGVAVSQQRETVDTSKTQLVQQKAALTQELLQLEKRLKEIRATLQSIDQTNDPGLEHNTLVSRKPVQQEHIDVLEAINVVSTKLQRLPVGITRETAPRSWIDNQPAKNFRESLEGMPGIVLRQRNGPRDFSISIRGLGAKQTFGARKIKMYEDGFSLTQSDGLSRLDLPDPWFMKAIDVERGASSALHGNFALGGTVNFRTRLGQDIHGVETLTQAGSYGYQKYATAIGQQYTNSNTAVFVSHERGDGFRAHSEFGTTTVDANLRFNIDTRQSVSIKAATNDIQVNTPQRLTLAQFQEQPTQAGTGAKENDRSRKDHRTIIGAKYINQVTPNTETSMTVEYDNKDINQKFGIILEDITPNWKTRADVHYVASVADMDIRSNLGIFFDYLESESTNFRNLADFHGTKQNVISNRRGTIQNLGFRIREEVDIMPHWTLGAGMGFEWSRLSVSQTRFGFTTGTFMSLTNANRVFQNATPDLSLVYHPSEHSHYWGRVSGGYGIPSLGDLTTTSAGLPGENLDLQDETNLNIELGGQTQLHPRFRLLLTGFLTFFKNELISQTVLGGTGTFTTNADASEYRGIELGWEWLPFDHVVVNGAYTYTDAKFINFTDSIEINGVGTSINRDGNTVPAIEPHVLNLRTAYDHPSGLGGWIELSWLDDYFVNNANTLKAQAATVVNANLHMTQPVNWQWVRFIKGFIQIDNVFDQTYMGSGAIVSDSTADPGKQAFLLAPPLSVFIGTTLGLF